jgi:hypothetical protein
MRSATLISTPSVGQIRKGKCGATDTLSVCGRLRIFPTPVGNSSGASAKLTALLTFTLALFMLVRGICQKYSNI